MTHQLSNKSEQFVNGINPKLGLIIDEALEISVIDFSIIRGFATYEEQKALFDKGITPCDGIINRSTHQDGNAFDFMCIVDGKGTWDIKYYYYLAGVFETIAKNHGIKIRSGVWFRSEDGVHIELISEVA